ncbi:hypothetical protein FHR83_006087 [Actinoplanes campanulatus]|uniref:Uncharacterized protein n=1 Tax=Actinoplanes campanulatus TaxID=113559 RepID=A0A7W5ALR7_9ACTN|nr:hypothetical protein [Actinoplanes campanulatus]MBB3098392.1 hypothetical protein [Actinoplanes campanulatus]GGN33997.1 hypothetical protein GCM10010109_56590 [Actinoplanes campanulatus]GID38645.1 hypothetical protein Aca09nite_51510 [Actinoplanes campanulatus]
MPERETQGHSARLLRGLVWAGVVLAPMAAAIVLIGGNSNSVRFAILLIAVSVVLIGASVLVRSDPVLLRMDIEDRVAQEVEALRRELRAELAQAAPAPAEPRPPLPVRNSGGRAQVAAPPEPDYGHRPQFVHQPGYEPQPEFAHADLVPQPVSPGAYEGYDQGGYDQSGYDDQTGYDQTGYEDYQPDFAPQPTNGRASVPGIVHPVSPARSSAPAGRASAAVPPPATGAARVAAAAVPMPGAAPVAAAAVAPPQRPRAAAAVVPPGPNGMMAPPAARAAAAVRPGPQYGRPEAPDGDFGAGDGYAGANGYEEPTADYKARRHRPSANDTNVGTLADFANYPGYSNQDSW